MRCLRFSCGPFDCAGPIKTSENNYSAACSLSSLLKANMITIGQNYTCLATAVMALPPTLFYMHAYSGILKQGKWVICGNNVVKDSGPTVSDVELGPFPEFTLSTKHALSSEVIDAQDLL